MKPLDKTGVQNILIRAVNWIGDAVMTTPALGAVRESFPGARITLLANPLVAELFSPHDWVDEVIVYDRKGRHAGIKGRLAMAAELRRRGFDLAILLQNAFDAALLARLARIPRRVGYRTDGRGVLLTHGVPLKRETKRLHHVQYYLAMLEECGIAASAKALHLTVLPGEAQAMTQRLAARGIDGDTYLLGINPGASYGSAKRWYPERFAAVADELARRWDARVVITGGPGEAGIAGEIEAAMEESCLNLAGKTSVRELMALVKRCDFFVTNDSGPMHLAAAFDVPLVAIFGPTDHTTTSPFSQRTALVRQETDCAPCLKRECPTDHRCMTAVTAGDVVAAAAGLRERLTPGGGR
ncbi:MAG TPA: lipopolysaccharide heptosyltransferase II [Geobacteraceae bacterium]